LFRSSCFIFILLSSILVARGQLQRYSFTEAKMGSPLTIILYCQDSIRANSLSKQCFQLVDHYVDIYSDYIDSSELNRLCATAGKAEEPTVVSPELYAILWDSKSAFQQSEGTFDITLGPVTRLWRKARKEKEFPSDSLVKARLALTGFTKMQFDTVRKSILLLQHDMQLDLGGIAQGYIAQKLIDLLKQEGISTALVNVSGDIVAIGAPPGTNGWTLGINMPESESELLPKHVLIKDMAITTSGDVYQFLEHNGKRYSHIVNPATGYGITSQRNVTVIAADGTLADWLTKACSILPVGKAKKLAASLHAEVLIVVLKKGKPVLYSTKGFKKYWKQISSQFK